MPVRTRTLTLFVTSALALASCATSSAFRAGEIDTVTLGQRLG